MPRIAAPVPKFTILVGLALASLPSLAVPVTINTAGYWLDTVGTNTLGQAGGGSAAGVVRSLFVATTTPGPGGGTTAAAFRNGQPIGAPTFEQGEWVYGTPNPLPTQRLPITVNFANGADTASFTGRDLSSLAAMPLVQNLVASGAVNPYSPVVSWTLPGAPATGDVDFIQLVFYDNVTNVEIGNRVTLGAGATSYGIQATLTPGFDLTVRVRLVDLFDDSLPFTLDNIQRESRAFVNYMAPVPEAPTWALMTAGLAASALRARRRR